MRICRLGALRIRQFFHQLMNPETRERERGIDPVRMSQKAELSFRLLPCISTLRDEEAHPLTSSVQPLKEAARKRRKMGD
jgi:hypothetical protein